MGKILEEYERNPFLRDFYEGSNVNLETEITFLLIHYSQLKKALNVDLSLKILRRRIFQRGRPYEISADLRYFKEYNDKVKQYFKKKAQSKVYFFDIDDLELDPDNRNLRQIMDKILEVMENKFISNEG